MEVKEETAARRARGRMVLEKTGMVGSGKVVFYIGSGRLRREREKHRCVLCVVSERSSRVGCVDARTAKEERAGGRNQTSNKENERRCR